MKKMTKGIVLFILLITMLATTACQSSVSASSNETTESQESSATESQESSATEEGATAETTDVTETTGAFTVTDMGGREVTFDKPVEKAYASNLIGILFIETLDISKLGGYTNELSDDEKEYIPEEYWDLPYLGGWSSANPTANIEELVNADIDVIFVTAIVSDKVIEMADTIQSQTGIPTVIVSSDLNELADAYTLMGQVMGTEDRAAELGEYCTNELAEVKAMTDSIPDEQRVSVYYAEGDQGLETDPSGSMHTQVFDFIGATNIADVSENTTNGLVGQSVVSLEQIIQWNPQYIIRNSTYTAADPDGAVTEILENSDWAGIDAVKNGNVYLTPSLPNNWIDRAPSVNRVLGVKWLANLLYPDYVDYDIRTEAKEFFDLFYQIELTDDQLDTILAESE